MALRFHHHPTTISISQKNKPHLRRHTFSLLCFHNHLSPNNKKTNFIPRNLTHPPRHPSIIRHHLGLPSRFPLFRLHHLHHFKKTIKISPFQNIFLVHNIFNDHKFHSRNRHHRRNALPIFSRIRHPHLADAHSLLFFQIGRASCR